SMDELVGLSEEARKLAMERFRLLQPHLEQNEPLKSVAQAAGISYRTAHPLVSEYRRHGLAALVRKKRADRGERRAVSDKGVCWNKHCHRWHAQIQLAGKHTNIGQFD